MIPQFDWVCNVCRCVMSLTSGIYWVDLSFFNNYSADVVSAFPWVVTKMVCIRYQSNYYINDRLYQIRDLTSHLYVFRILLAFFVLLNCFNFISQQSAQCLSGFLAPRIMHIVAFLKILKWTWMPRCFAMSNNRLDLKVPFGKNSYS